MRLLYCIVTSKPFRWSTFVVLVAASLLWLVKGLSFCESQRVDRRANRIVSDLTEQLRRRDPAAADELDRIAGRHDRNALAATLQERYSRQGASGLLDLARELRQTGTASDLRLAELACDPALVPASTREMFLTGHLSALEQTDIIYSTGRTSPDQNGAANKLAYLATLTEASRDENIWRMVRENPIMVFLLQQVENRDLLEFYDREKDWLDDVLYVCLTAQVSKEESRATLQQLAGDLLQTAHDNHPLFRETLELCMNNSGVKDEETATGIMSIFSLFSTYGQVIRNSVGQGGIPLEEFMSVLFANQEFFQMYQEEKPEMLTARILQIRNTMPAVWKLAPEHLFMLQMATDVPGVANELALRFGTDDIAFFIYSKYADCVSQAAQAIARYGDLGIYILGRYEKSEIFRDKLATSALGVRIVPYTSKFGDAGLERIAENEAWLDKYFDSAGNPRQKSWWASLPVGSVVDVAKNWANGMPSEWSELGWAAVDVADASLLVLTLGSSSGLTAARATAASGARLGARELSKHVALTISREGKQAIMKRGARAAARTGAASTTHRSLMRTAWKRTFANTGLRLAPVVNAGRTSYVCRRAIVLSPLQKALRTTWSSARNVSRTWHNVPLPMRHTIYRSLLYSGLAVTLIFHTAPELIEALPTIGENLGELAGRFAHNAIEGTAKALNAGLNTLLANSVRAEWRPFTIYAIVSLVLLLLITMQYRRLSAGKRNKVFIA